MNSMPFSQQTAVIEIETQPKTFVMITEEIGNWLQSLNATLGMVTLFVQHTSASLIIQENADPSVLSDLKGSLDLLAPEGRDYAHSMEGPDDMPAHIKSMLTSTSLSVPVVDGRLELGTWQGIFLIEHRAQANRRKIRLLYAGESTA